MKITAQMMTAAKQLFGMKKKYGVKTEIAKSTKTAGCGNERYLASF